MLGRLGILVLCGVAVSAPAFAGVKVKNLEEYWANQRAYHQDRIVPNPEQTWWTTIRPPADEAWTPPTTSPSEAGTGTAVTAPVSEGGEADFMKIDKDTDRAERDDTSKNDEESFNPFSQ